MSEKVLTFKREPLPHLRSTIQGSGRGARFESEVQAIVALADEHDLPSDVGRTAMTRLVKGTGLKSGRRHVDAAVDFRKRRGGVIELPGWEAS